MSCKVYLIRVHVWATNHLGDRRLGDVRLSAWRLECSLEGAIGMH